ncbi:MAG: hypothetical protein LBC96_01210 [Lachnospiraceae bacterium]|jgi:hypothetical protein|nr:hypothetical protein [Lachnospiraceae bacterium]
MKKMLDWLVPVKSLAAMFFTGFIVLYMIIGVGVSYIGGTSSLDSGKVAAIPFPYVLQSMVFAIVMALLWSALFSDIWIEKMSYFVRLFVFVMVLFIVFTGYGFILYFYDQEFSYLWVAVPYLVLVGIVITSLIFRGYFQILGRRYTAALAEYKE